MCSRGLWRKGAFVEMSISIKVAQKSNTRTGGQTTLQKQRTIAPQHTESRSNRRRLIYVLQKGGTNKRWVPSQRSSFSCCLCFFVNKKGFFFYLLSFLCCCFPLLVHIVCLFCLCFLFALFCCIPVCDVSGARVCKLGGGRGSVGVVGGGMKLGGGGLSRRAAALSCRSPNQREEYCNTRTKTQQQPLRLRRPL